MRFNSKELAHLAQQSADKFDKDGLIWMKDKQDGLFKKGEAYVERYCRLKGNMLFYFKGRDAQADPLGILILERCTVELDVDEDSLHGFMLVYEGDENAVHLASRQEEDRDSWIQALHIASYECLKMQLQSLREQLHYKTGFDPLVQMAEQDSGHGVEFQQEYSSEEPNMEICIACVDLPNDKSGQPPNPFVVMTSITPPQQNWVQRSHSEIIEKCNNPQFLKSIGFGIAESTDINFSTRVKLTVYHVNERMTNTMSQIGYAVFTLNEILTTTDKRLQLTLNSPDFGKAGCITIQAWLHSNSIPQAQTQTMKSDATDVGIPQPKGLETLKLLYTNVIKRTFRFDTNKARMKLFVQEMMAESKWNFSIPIQLLKLWIKEEREQINMLQDLGELADGCNRTRQEDLDFYMSAISTYTQSVRYLSSYKGPFFKPSSKKMDKEFEFIPVNLHLQRMCVVEEDSNTSDCHDIISVGCFTAFGKKFKAGGLKRLLDEQRELHTAESTLGRQTKMVKACYLLNRLTTLKEDVHGECEKLCRSTLLGTPEDLRTAIDVVNSKVGELVQTCDCALFNESSAQHMRARTTSFANSSGPQLKPGKATSAAKEKLQDQAAATEKKNWRWTGSNFVRSPTMEPWEMTYVNTEAAAVCLLSLIEDIIQNKNNPMDRPKWLSQISPKVIELQKFIEILCKRAHLATTFLMLMENQENVHLMQTIKYRRDIVFAQAVTALTTGFATKMYENFENEAFLKQVCQIGLLLHFEGLISCYGNEMGILEDMLVAVEDLINVSFKLVKAEDERDDMPVLDFNSYVKTGRYPDLNRHAIEVCLPVPEKIFNRLPSKLQDGYWIKVFPSFFNIGINEKASLAEKFGDTSLQLAINVSSFKKLNSYYEEFCQAMGDPDTGKAGPGKLSDLLRQLQYNVITKKSKNVDVLFLSSEIARKLNAIRFTSCKSAKDRTGMSVTLEQVRILQQEYNLASHVFTQALDCFRSEGVRRENTFKNTGVRKYAFNSLQLHYLPRLYRPASGTYGNVQM